MPCTLKARKKSLASSVSHSPGLRSALSGGDPYPFAPGCHYQSAFLAVSSAWSAPDSSTVWTCSDFRFAQTKGHVQTELGLTAVIPWHWPSQSVATSSQHELLLCQRLLEAYGPVSTSSCRQTDRLGVAFSRRSRNSPQLKSYQQHQQGSNTLFRAVETDTQPAARLTTGTGFAEQCRESCTNLILAS